MLEDTNPANWGATQARTGGQPGDDPDTSDRWVPPEAHESPRRILETYFPDLVGAAERFSHLCSSFSQAF